MRIISSPTLLRLTFTTICFATTAFPLSAAPPAPTPSPRPDTLQRNKYVEPTSWGKARGRVYDIATGAPLDGVSVTIWQDGVFADKGRTTGKTDVWGSFGCDAMLGRISSNVDVRRLLVNLFAPIPGGGIEQKTKRIDISRLTMRVTKPGYLPFEGTVPCRELSPDNFSVTMEPVLLVPIGSREVSTVGEDWGAVSIGSISVTPVTTAGALPTSTVLRPGMKARVRAEVVWPAQNPPKDTLIRCRSFLWGEKELKPEKERNPTTGNLVFSATFDVPKKQVTTAQTLSVFVARCPIDVAKRGATRSTLLQVAATDTAVPVAEARFAAYDHYLSGHAGESIAALRPLCASPEALRFDLLSLGQIATETKDTATAVVAFSRLQNSLQSETEQARLLSSQLYAEALLADGKYGLAYTEADTAIRSVREKERKAKVPPGLLVVAGQAALESKEYGRAEEMRTMLTDWGITSADVPGLARFQNALRLAQAQTKVEAAPDSPDAHAEYGRVLLDQAQWAEAITELQAADKLSPGLPAIQRDIAYALLSLKGTVPEAQADLDKALADAESQVIIRDAKDPKKTSKSKDFMGWYTLGMLRYVKYRTLQDKQEDAIEWMDTCQEALVEALRCARAGAKVNQGSYNPYFGYMGNRVVSVAGFAYPQADSVFVLRESLRVLKNDPDNRHGLFNQSSALLDMGYADLARAPLARLVQISDGNDLTEAHYVSAMISLKQGDRETAVAVLQNVVKANPRHGAAWKELARLYTEDGDTTGAAECLTAYAKVYGSPEAAIGVHE